MTADTPDYDVRCTSCGSFVSVDNEVGAGGLVRYQCGACGHAGAKHVRNL